MARHSGESRQAKARSESKVAEAIAAGGVLEVERNGAVKANGTTNGKDATELHEFLHALQAMRAGDFSVRMAGDHDGIVGKIADTFNEIVAANQRMAHELERAGEIVGREGKTRHRVKFGLSSG